VDLQGEGGEDKVMMMEVLAKKTRMVLKLLSQAKNQIASHLNTQTLDRAKNHSEVPHRFTRASKTILHRAAQSVPN
jgi:hypothetical protein